jgi:hypothetical protein
MRDVMYVSLNQISWRWHLCLTSEGACVSGTWVNGSGISYGDARGASYWISEVPTLRSRVIWLISWEYDMKSPWKYVEIISHQLRHQVRWAISWRVIDRDVNILRIRWKTCAIKLYIFIWIKLTKINSIQNNYKLKWINFKLTFWSHKFSNIPENVLVLLAIGYTWTNILLPIWHWTKAVIEDKIS